MYSILISHTCAKRYATDIVFAPAGTAERIAIVFGCDLDCAVFVYAIPELPARVNYRLHRSGVLCSGQLELEILVQFTFVLLSELLKAFAVDSEISSFDHDVFLELFKVK